MELVSFHNGINFSLYDNENNKIEFLSILLLVEIHPIGFLS